MKITLDMLTDPAKNPIEILDSLGAVSFGEKLTQEQELRVCSIILEDLKKRCSKTSITIDYLNELIEKTKNQRIKYWNDYLLGYRKEVNNKYLSRANMKRNCFQIFDYVSLTFVYTNNNVYTIISRSDKTEDKFTFIPLLLNLNQINRLNLLRLNVNNKEILDFANIKSPKIRIKEEPLYCSKYDDINLNCINISAYNDGISEANTDNKFFEFISMFS